jgi:hypothetical protein
MIEMRNNLAPRELRLFLCLWLPLFVVALGCVLWFKWNLTAAAASVWVCGAMLAVGGLIFPLLGRLTYRALMYAAFPIGFVMSYALLAAVFYLVMSPWGMILRLIGHDPMRRRFDRKRASYWIGRPPPRHPESYFNQY